MSGRGGAGNIEAANRKILRDLEASQDLAESQQDPSPIEVALQNDRPPRTIATSGRGGAGNTYNPAELLQTGQYNDTVDASKASSERNTAAADSEQGARMMGRGGAGNYLPPVAEARKPSDQSKNEGGLAPAEVSQIKQTVEKALAKPDAAYLGPKEREEAVPDDGV